MHTLIHSHALSCTHTHTHTRSYVCTPTRSHTTLTALLHIHTHAHAHLAHPLTHAALFGFARGADGGTEASRPLLRFVCAHTPRTPSFLRAPLALTPSPSEDPPLQISRPSISQQGPHPGLGLTPQCSAKPLERASAVSCTWVPANTQAPSCLWDLTRHPTCYNHCPVQSPPGLGRCPLL